MLRALSGSLRGLIGLAGTAAILGALLSLWMPLGLGAVDRAGAPIPCGTGWHPDSTVAVHEDALNHEAHRLLNASYVVSDYVSDCNGLISQRRLLASGFVIAGITITAALYVRNNAAGRRAIEPVATAGGQLNSFAAS